MRDPRTPAPGRAVLATLAVAAAVLVTVGVTAGLGRRTGGHDTAAPASSTATGPSADPADVAACLVPDFATDPAEVTVVYSQLQQAPRGTTPVMVLRNAAGEIRLCDLFGGDNPAVAPPGRATTAEPVAFYASGRRDWDCAGRALHRFTLSEWLSVADPVRTVRLRFVVDGAARPWFSTSAVDGLAHLQAWLDGPVDPHTHVLLQQQALDAGGTRIAQSALPASQRLPGCQGGSAQIG